MVSDNAVYFVCELYQVCKVDSYVWSSSSKGLKYLL
jgi:hypothetical protein